MLSVRLICPGSAGLSLNIRGQKYKGRIFKSVVSESREETAAVKTKEEPRGLINHFSKMQHSHPLSTTMTTTSFKETTHAK